MARSFLYRCTAFVVAGVTAVCFGLIGQASVQAATISNTGPDSYNSIKTINTAECKVTNNNNLRVNNSNNQSATTGDVVVKHNTTVGGGWGSWDPAVWQAQGYTYEQWHAAFMNYMASQQAEWSANWGSLAPSSGVVTSGNAANTNATNIGINVNNGAVSSKDGHICGGHGANNTTPGNPGTPGSGSQGSVLGATTVGSGQAAGQTQGQGGSGHVLGAHTGGQAGRGRTHNGQGASAQFASVGGAVNANNPGGGSSNPACGCQPTSNTISNTGPGSHNSITTITHNTTKVTNNNNVSVNNTSNQSATSGNVASSHNTTTSGGDSGDGNNQNGTNANVNLSN